MSSSDHLPLLPGPGNPQIFTPGASREALEQEVLPAFIRRCRWFGGKARQPRSFRVHDVVALDPAPDAPQLVLVNIDYMEGAPDTYLLPLQVARHRDAETLLQGGPTAVAARLEGGAVLGDALYLEAFRAELFRLIAGGASLAGQHGRITGSPGAILGQHSSPPVSRAHSVEQSNSSIIYGDHIFLKLYRRLEGGVNPDAEILRFLGERNFPHVPPFAGAIEYHGTDGATRVLALALGLVPNDGDAWSFTLRHLEQYFAFIQASDRWGAAQMQADYLTAAAQLGTRTGELHLALAGDSVTPAFTPEPWTPEDASSIADALRVAVQQVDRLLLERFEVLDLGTRALAQQFRDSAPAFRANADVVSHLATSAAKTRTHGDYHLGQVLHGPSGFVIIDFEGEPLRPLAERRRKMSPFRDVAGMLRSFHYAAHAALEPVGAARDTLEGAAESWARQAQQAFLSAWEAATLGAVFRDPDPVTERVLLNAFLLEKALYEIRYEVNNRPSWLGIPLRGVLALLETEASGTRR